MIIQPTTLILGAGASSDYGFPTGKALKNYIINELIHLDNNLNKFLLINNYSQNEINSFRNELLDSATDSIDEFLESRSDYMDMGKLAITYVLAESESANIQPKNDWYKMFVQALCNGVSFEGIRENKISVITFNYDRSLEHYLFKAIRARHKRSESEVAEIVKSLPILHVHGQIGYLPWQHNTSARGYGLYDDFNSLCESSKLIRTIHDAQDPLFEEAHNHMDKAQNIYFLGFGYHSKNLERLKLSNLNPDSKKIMGTSFGYNQRRLTEVMDRTMHKIAIDGISGAGRFNVYDFLDNNISFR